MNLFTWGRRALSGALVCVLRSQLRMNQRINILVSTVQDLQDLQARLAADVATQSADIAVIQNNLTVQLKDLSDEIQRLQDAQPTLDLTNITMSINQIESNHLALLALAKQAAGVETIPPPPPLIPTAPSSDQPKPPTVDEPL